MAIESFDARSCTVASDAIDAALKAVAADLGISIKVGRGTYSREGDTFTLKLEMGTVCADGNVATKESRDYLEAVNFEFTVAAKAGLKPEHLNADFTTHQGSYTLTGLAPRSKKYPILAKCKRTGKTFKFPIAAVAAAMVGASK